MRRPGFVKVIILSLTLLLLAVFPSYAEYFEPIGDWGEIEIGIAEEGIVGETRYLQSGQNTSFSTTLSKRARATITYKNKSGNWTSTSYSYSAGTRNASLSAYGCGSCSVQVYCASNNTTVTISLTNVTGDNEYTVESSNSDSDGIDMTVRVCTSHSYQWQTSGNTHTQVCSNCGARGSSHTAGVSYYYETNVGTGYSVHNACCSCGTVIRYYETCKAVNGRCEKCGRSMTYGLYLYKNDGSGGYSWVSANMGCTYTPTAPTRTGYTFMGWSTSSTATSGVSGIVMPTNTDWGFATDYYATWRANTYTVRYNANKPSNASSSVASVPGNSTWTYNSNATLGGSPTLTGWVFGGWYREAACTNKVGNGGAALTTPNLSSTQGATVDLYAKWTPITYTVSYNGNGSTSGSTASSSHTYDTAKNLTANGFARTGYTFKGWATSANGSLAYSNSQSVKNFTTTSGSNIPLYALWTPVTIALRFDPQGGSNGTSNKDVTYDAALPNITSPTRSGYTFKGYFSGQNGTGTKYYNADGTGIGASAFTANTTIYAYWTANEYSVTFDKQGGTGGSDGTNVVYGSALPAVSMPEKTGYTDLGYYTAANGGGTKYYNGDGTSAAAWAVAANTTLYLNWKANTYTVSFNGNKPAASSHSVLNIPASATWTYNANSTLPGAPSLEGYTFKGWFKEADCTNKVGNAGASLTAANLTAAANGSVTLYAGWTNNTYTVNYAANGGNGTMTSDTFIYEEAKELKTPTFTKTGYHFDHWNTKADGTGNSYDSGESVKNLTSAAGGSVTMYAQWVPNTYKIAFNGNGATSGSTATQTHTYDVSLALANNGFVKAGYDFVGWANEKTSATADYTNQQSVKNLSDTQSATVTLYAVWKKATFNVTLVQSPGSGGTASVVATYDTAMPELAALPTRTGYVFGGYYTEQNGEGTKYYNDNGKSANTYKIASDASLYAKWIPNTYTVTFDMKKPAGSSSEITGAPEPAVWTYDSSATLPGAPALKGWTFDGWYKDPSQITKLGNAGATLTTPNLTASVQGSTTVYAKWSPNSYNVKFNPNDGATGEAKTQTFTYDTSAKELSANTFTKTGYHFKKWNTKADGTGKNYSDCEAVNNLVETANGVYDLYSFFEVNLYTIAFDANGGEGSLASIPMDYEKQITLPASPMTRTGYLYSGWNTKADGTGTVVADQASVKQLTAEEGAAVTLYAQWTPITYKLKFNANGGTGTMADQPVSYDATAKIKVNAFTRQGYEFAGWATSASGEIVYTDTQSIKNLTAANNAVIDLYAKWSVNPYFVRYNASGASGTMPNQAFTYDTAQNLLECGFEKPGYHLAGWTVTEGSQTVIYEPQESVINLSATVNDIVDLYAVWARNGYAVRFDGGEGGYIDPASGKTQMDDLAFIYDDPNGKLALSKNLYLKTGYHFTGWFDELNNKTYDDQEELINVTTEENGIVTLVAQWSPNHFTVLLDANGADGGEMITSMAFTYDEPQKLPAMTYTKEGYTYRRYWRDHPDDKGLSYNEQATIKNLTAEDNGVVTIYVQWKPHTYSIQYNGNGATGGSMATQVCTFDQHHNLTKNAFVKKGYIWTGWESVINNITVRKNDEADVYNLTSADGAILTFNAQWMPVTYTVHFDGNKPAESTQEITGMPADKVFTYDSATDSLGSAPALDGWIFDGWYLDPECKNRLGAADAVLNAPNLTDVDEGTVTVFAFWHQNTYRVAYHGNKPAAATAELKDEPAAATWMYDRNEKLAAAPELTGWTFNGWYKEADCVNKVGNANETLTKPNLSKIQDATVDLYAKWTANTYKVTFDANKGTTPTAEKTVTYDSTYGTLPTPARTGYTFAGWYTEKEEGERIYSTTMVSILSDITLYAHWTANVYKLSLDKCGAETDGTDAVFFEFEQSRNIGGIDCYYYADRALANPLPLGTTITVPTLTGYTFKGYYTEENGNGTQLIDAQGKVAEDRYKGDPADESLFAYWTANRYTVAYMANTPENATASVTGLPVSATWTYDSVSTLGAAPALTGWRFEGWYREPECTALAGNGGQTLSKANFSAVQGSTVKLYAKWSANTFTVKFDKNSEYADDVTMEDQSFVYDVPQTLTASAFTREGYLFDGWALEKNGELVFVDEEEVSDLTTEHEGVVTLYVVWKANAYYIAFDGNGASSGTMGQQAATYDVAENLRANRYVKAGYTFGGWLNDDGTVYGDQEVVVNLTSASGGTATLVARWLPNSYKIVYNKNSSLATGTMGMQLVDYDTTTTIRTCSFARPGYVCTGWNTKADGTGAVYTAGQEVSNMTAENNATINLYAVWAPVGYSVEYRANASGTAGTTASQQLVYDERTTLNANGYAREGYTFKYWTENADGTGKIYSNKASVLNMTAAADGTVVLYAQWKANAYTIDFHKNDPAATGTMAPLSMTYGAERELTANGYAKVGYLFDSWNSKADGTGIRYENRQKVSNLSAKDKDTVSLYAQWVPVEYRIAFNGNEGLGTMSELTVKYNDSVTLPANAFARKGWKFSGWNTRADGTGTSYADEETVSMVTTKPETVTFYAQWEKISYTVVFDGNGADVGVMEDVRLVYNQSKKLVANTFTRFGYSFDSWNLKADGTGTKFDDLAVITDLTTEDGAIISFYAQWKPITYTVTYDFNGGTGSAVVPDVTATYGTEFTLPSPSLTKAGHDFTGWNLKQNGSGTMYAKGGKAKNLTSVDRSTVTLYAYYKPFGYKVSFNANGGSGTMDALDCEFTKKIALSANLFTRSGYNFAGWNTKADGSGTYYGNKATVQDLTTTKDGVVTLYAQWARQTYTIVFNGNGGSGTMADATAEIGVAKRLPANGFVKNGFEFSGWNTEANGSGTSFAEEGSVTDLATKDGAAVVLYAQWSGMPYPITYELAGGSWADGYEPSAEHYTDEIFVLPTSRNITKDGYIFLGWSMDPQNGSLISVIPEDTHEITVYARWYSLADRRSGLSPRVSNSYSVNGDE